MFTISFVADSAHSELLGKRPWRPRTVKALQALSLRPPAIASVFETSSRIRAISWLCDVLSDEKGCHTTLIIVAEMTRRACAILKSVDSDVSEMGMEINIRSDATNLSLILSNSYI